MGSVLDNAKPYGTSMVGKCPHCGVKLKLNILILFFIVVVVVLSLMKFNEVTAELSFYTKVGLLSLWPIAVILLSRYFTFSIYKPS